MQHTSVKSQYNLVFPDIEAAYHLRIVAHAQLCVRVYIALTRHPRLWHIASTRRNYVFEFYIALLCAPCNPTNNCMLKIFDVRVAKITVMRV